MASVVRDKMGLKKLREPRIMSVAATERMDAASHVRKLVLSSTSNGSISALAMQ